MIRRALAAWKLLNRIRTDFGGFGEFAEWLRQARVSWGLMERLRAHNGSEFWAWLEGADVVTADLSNSIRITITVPLPPDHPISLATHQRRSRAQLKRRMDSAGA